MTPRAFAEQPRIENVYPSRVPVVRNSSASFRNWLEFFSSRNSQAKPLSGWAAAYSLCKLSISRRLNTAADSSLACRENLSSVGTNNAATDSAPHSPANIHRILRFTQPGSDIG